MAITLLEICDQWIQSAEGALCGDLRRVDRMKIMDQRDYMVALRPQIAAKEA